MRTWLLTPGETTVHTEPALERAAGAAMTCGPSERVGPGTQHAARSFQSESQPWTTSTEGPLQNRVSKPRRRCNPNSVCPCRCQRIMLFLKVGNGVGVVSKQPHPLATHQGHMHTMSAVSADRVAELHTQGQLLSPVGGPLRPTGVSPLGAQWRVP